MICMKYSTGESLDDSDKRDPEMNLWFTKFHTSFYI